MPGKLEPLNEGPLFQLNGILGPLFQKGIEPLFQPLLHGILLLPPPLLQLIGLPLPILKPLPGPLPHDWLLPIFMFGFISKLSKPQPPALALLAMLAKRMLAIIFFMVLLSILEVHIRKQVG